jgi:hypothetical protein
MFLIDLSLCLSELGAKLLELFAVPGQLLADIRRVFMLQR